MAHASSGGQTALDLGAVRPVRFLHFLSIKGRHYIDAFGDHVFEVKQTIVSDRICWRASIRKKDQRFAITRRFFAELGAAQDFLEAEATRMGGAS